MWCSTIFIFQRWYKSLFIPWKIRSSKWFKYLLCGYVYGYDWYLLQLIVLFKPDFNFWSSVVLSWVDKVTTFISVIVNLPPAVELVITQVDDHVKIGLTSQLINGI